jgi:hypothetical protein
MFALLSCTATCALCTMAWCHEEACARCTEAVSSEVSTLTIEKTAAVPKMHTNSVATQEANCTGRQAGSSRFTGQHSY